MAQQTRYSLRSPKTPEDQRSLSKSPNSDKRKDVLKSSSGSEKLEDSSQDDSSITDDSFNKDELVSTDRLSSSRNNESSFDRSLSAKRSTSPVTRSRKDPNTKSPKQIAKHKKPDEVIVKKSSMNENIITLFLMVILAVLSNFILHSAFLNSAINPEISKPIFEQFKNEKLNILKKAFPSQDKIFWKTITVPLKRIFTEQNPQYPAVLLFVVPKGPSSSLTGSCLAYHLTDHLNQFHGLSDRAFIDIEKDLTHASASRDKKELDDKLIQYYGTEGRKGVVVDHFEKLSPTATLLFHGYCDDDNATYKNVSIVLVLHTNIDQEVLNNLFEIDNYLQDLWVQELDEDKITSLISLIANNVAIVTQEDPVSLRKICPSL